MAKSESSIKILAASTGVSFKGNVIVPHPNDDKEFIVSPKLAESIRKFRKHHPDCALSDFCFYVVSCADMLPAPDEICKKRKRRCGQ